jgi:hypothetical protein
MLEKKTPNKVVAKIKIVVKLGSIKYLGIPKLLQYPFSYSKLAKYI